MPLLFSYGTLQLESVQRAVFGRAPRVEPGELAGFEVALTRIDDPGFVAETGQALHNTLTPTADPSSRVKGVVLEVTDDELRIADAYEQRASYRRIQVVLMSGVPAWVYVAQ